MLEIIALVTIYFLSFVTILCSIATVYICVLTIKGQNEQSKIIAEIYEILDRRSR